MLCDYGRICLKENSMYSFNCSSKWSLEGELPVTHFVVRCEQVGVCTVILDARVSVYAIDFLVPW